MNKALAIASLAFLVACQTVPAPMSAEDLWCAFNKPRPSLSNADTAPRAVVDDHNAYQDKGIAWCRWKAQ